MTFEILYPGFLLYGERGNIEYLKRMIPEATLVETQIHEKPYFVDHPVEFIYMGPMTEKNLGLVCAELMPYKERLKELMEGGTCFLIVNSALEIFGRSIELPEGEALQTLNLLPFTTKRNMKDRHDTTVMGTFRSMHILGYDARFTEQYGNESMPFLTVERGHGFHRGSRYEGIHYKNFIGTNLLGPLLLTNPPFARYLKKKLTGREELPYEERMDAAYAVRLEHFTNDKEILQQKS